MLPKAHLPYSRMSGSGWVITPSWLFASWRSFLYSFSVYSCYLFLISSASVRSIPFLSFIVPIFAWNVPLVSLIFLKRSLVLPLYCFPQFLCITHLRKPYLVLYYSIRCAGIICWQIRNKLLPPPFIVFMRAFIYSLNKDLMDENVVSIGFVFCTLKINMKRTNPICFDEAHLLWRDAYWFKYWNFNVLIILRILTIYY